jgi:predicted transcriptional regulator YdeE
MKTELIHLNSLLLGGVSFFGDPFSRKGSWDSENEIGKTWSRFMGHITENSERPYSRNKPYLYEIHIYGSETAAKGYFEVFVGEEVNTAKLPFSLSSKFFPESDYLKVTLYGQEITSDWCQTFDTDIIPECGVKRNASFIIQAYDERFKGMDHLDDSVLDVYIPVEA